MKNFKIYQLVLILSPFVFSFAFGLDIYIPIVPQMTHIFNTSPALIQLTLSLFLFATGVGQLLIGPLSDQYGRKSIFYVASTCFAVGSLGCAFSDHIGWLILARLVSALGACGMLVTSFALVRDLYCEEQSAKVYSFLEGAIGISPTFAPIIGGYLAYYLGWQSVFIFLAFIGFFSFLITKFFVHETLEKQNRVKLDSTVFKRYLEICSNRQFLIYSIISGLAEGVFFSFFSISPFIIINLLGVPTHQFGYYFAIFGSVIALGGLTSGKVIEKIGLDATVIIGIILMMFGGSLMLTWHYLDSLSLQGFLIPMAVSCMGSMFLVGVSASAALEPFGKMAGTASAAFGAIEFGIAAAVGSVLMIFPVYSTLPYGCTIILMAVSCLILFLIPSRSKKSTKEMSE